MPAIPGDILLCCDQDESESLEKVPDRYKIFDVMVITDKEDDNIATAHAHGGGCLEIRTAGKNFNVPEGGQSFDKGKASFAAGPVLTGPVAF
jgi:hypothetical protein